MSTRQSDSLPAFAALTREFGPRFSTAIEVRRLHGRDEGWHPLAAPEGVIFVQSVADVITAVRICAQHRLPVIAFGAGSGMEGNVNAVAGGVAIDLSAMTAIRSVHPQDKDCTVEAGVTRSQLDAHLRDQGLFFPVDPGADATLGGMAATRASGTMTLRYGSMRDNVIGLQVVLADGSVIRTGGRARKSSAGYDLTKLFVGSEGTLGIITELTLRLHPIASSIVAATAAMADFGRAINLVTDLISLGLPLARAEFMDELAIEAVCRHFNRDLARTPTLFLEFQGSDAEVLAARDMLGELASPAGALTLSFADRPEDRARLWQVRHEVAYAEPTLRPGARALVTDVCVPISELASCVTATQADLKASGLIAPIVGHVGDGNFHLAILIDPNDPLEVATANGLQARLVERALQMGGTSTGEHGIGLGKRAYLRAEHGEAADLMWRIKMAVDPLNLMNPHKIFDPAEFGTH